MWDTFSPFNLPQLIYVENAEGQPQNVAQLIMLISNLVANPAKAVSILRGLFLFDPDLEVYLTV